MDKEQQMAALRDEADSRSDRIVWGEGPLDARLMLVGEAPGAEEERLDRPFVGPAGRFLDQELSTAGIPRAGIYLTGAVKHRTTTPGTTRPRNRAPTVCEVEAWRDVLLREIEIILPKVILCLGLTAARAILGREAKLRDDARGPSGTRVLVTYHPSFVRRFRATASCQAFVDFRSDLTRAAAEAGLTRTARRVLPGCEEDGS